MSSLTYGRWSPPVHSDLADLEGAWNDLFSAREFFSRLEAAFEHRPHDYTSLDILVTAALARYARSFTTGVRKRLNASSIETLDVAEKMLHERLLAIRDKHVAHPVNAFESHAVYVGFCPEDLLNARATVVSTGTRTSIGLTMKEATASRALCETWLEHVRKLMQAEESRLLEHAQQLTARQLLALPRGPIRPHHDPERRRPRA